MQESGLTEIIPFTCISAIWGQQPGPMSLITHILSSLLTIGSGGSLWWKLDCCQIAGIALPGLRNSYLEGWIHGCLGHPYLLRWQEILHFTVQK